jgi:hypothetical protein
MSSGTAEAKQAIADNLNLDGEVIIIWDGINGVMVNIDQTEVDRLSTLFIKISKIFICKVTIFSTIQSI